MPLVTEMVASQLTARRHARTAEAGRLSLGQSLALLGAVGRELTFGLPNTARAMRAWRARAEQIPDPELRADALHSLDNKRGYADGAALFTILTRRRHHGLLTVLTSWETIVDYLDNVSERWPTYENGQQLHTALVDALDLTRPAANDYYRDHPSGDDGGYLDALVDSCRRACRTLPSYGTLRPNLVRSARRRRVLGLNHEPDPDLRDAGLRAWAAEEYPDAPLPWWELTGAASATLHTHALLALAAEPRVEAAEVAAVEAAYLHIDLCTTLLDSYVDWHDDREAGAHRYLDHYESEEAAVARMCESARTAVELAQGAPRAHRHHVICASMIALYLSAPAANTPLQRATTDAIAASSGRLARLLIPALRTWRAAYGQRE
jgi:tetraprenyl-beta-curcumene synthase